MSKKYIDLRDRIAEVIFRAEMKADEAHTDQWGRLREVYEANAQAIIDEFGLTVETVEGVMDPNGDYDAGRVVGKWEKQ